MGIRIRTIAAYVIVALAVAVGGFFVGRATVDIRSAHDSGYRAGHYDGYFAGLPVGGAEGRQEGRALQEGAALDRHDRQPVRNAFKAGYAAGADDAFAGYDGGWSSSTPYVITVHTGGGDSTYRIASRVPVQSGVDYYLCADGHELCQEPRR